LSVTQPSGQPSPQPPDPDASRIRAELEARLAEVEAELTQIALPAEDTGGISFGKRVGDGTSVAVERLAQVAVHDGIGALRNEIVRALAKLDEGTYGFCDRCGGPIPQGRLEARPWATHCVTCPSDGPG
jgi:RNA polymerase-binding transcription factor DksA